MKLYFVRHGESEANVLAIISNRGYKHGLTEKGRGQAAALAENLRSAAITRIYTSPLKRAVQTAEILAEAFGVAYSITPALREFDCGVAEDRGDPESWAIWHGVWDDWHQRQKWESCAEGGECFLDLKARFVPFVESLVEQFGQTDENILLVGHGALFLSMLPVTLANVEAGFALAQAMKNTDCVVAELRDAKLICIQWGEIAVSG